MFDIKWSDVKDFYPSPHGKPQVHMMEQWLRKCAADRDGSGRPEVGDQVRTYLDEEERLMYEGANKEL